MSLRNRTLHIGAKTVIIKNVPDEVTDEMLTKYTYAKLLELGLLKEGGQAS